MFLIRIPLVATVLSLGSSGAIAQLTEIEPNDAKATATVASGLVSGATLVGNTTSSSGAGRDYWLISTAPAPLSVYRHKLTLTPITMTPNDAWLCGSASGGTTLPGCNPPTPGSGGVVLSAETELQHGWIESATTPRYCAWYGFGKGEQIYFRVAGNASTTANYTATLTTTAVPPIALPVTFRAGPITFSTHGLGANDTDMELHLFDANLDAIPDGANDWAQCWPTPEPALLTRTLAAGTYYVAAGFYDMATRLPCAPDDSWLTTYVQDFPGCVTTTSPGQLGNQSFQVTDSAGSYTQFAVADVRFCIKFYRFDVVDGPIALCDPGVAGVIACPCSNPPSGTGRGCDNSATTGGASIGASGHASLAADTLVFTTSAQTANGTTILLQGQSSLASGVAFGQGVRCVGGVLKRLYAKSPSGTGGISAPATGEASVSARSASLGDPIALGGHRYYMAYYRDPAVLGGCAATSTFNATNALDVTWN